MNIEFIERAAWKRADALRLDLEGDMSMCAAASALEDAQVLVRVLRDVKALQDMGERAAKLREIYGESRHRPEPPPDDIEF